MTFLSSSSLEEGERGARSLSPSVPDADTPIEASCDYLSPGPLVSSQSVSVSQPLSESVSHPLSVSVSAAACMRELSALSSSLSSLVDAAETPQPEGETLGFLPGPRCPAGEAGVVSVAVDSTPQFTSGVGCSEGPSNREQSPDFSLPSIGGAVSPSYSPLLPEGQGSVPLKGLAGKGFTCGRGGDFDGFSPEYTTDGAPAYGAGSASPHLHLSIDPSARASASGGRSERMHGSSPANQEAVSLPNVREDLRHTTDDAAGPRVEELLNFASTALDSAGGLGLEPDSEAKTNASVDAWNLLCRSLTDAAEGLCAARPSVQNRARGPTEQPRDGRAPMRGAPERQCTIQTNCRSTPGGGSIPKTECTAERERSSGGAVGMDSEPQVRCQNSEIGGGLLAESGVREARQEEGQADTRQPSQEAWRSIEEEAAAFVTSLHETFLTPQRLLNVSEGSASPLSLPMSVDEAYEEQGNTDGDGSPFDANEQSPSGQTLREQGRSEGQGRMPENGEDCAAWAPCNQSLFTVEVKSAQSGKAAGVADLGGDDEEAEDDLTPKIDWEVTCEDSREENSASSEAGLSVSQEEDLSRSTSQADYSSQGKKVRTIRVGNHPPRPGLTQGLSIIHTNSAGWSSPGYTHSVFGRCSTYSSLHSAEGICFPGVGSPLGACPMGSGRCALDSFKSGVISREVGEILGEEGGGRSLNAFSRSASRCSNHPSMVDPGSFAELRLSTLEQFYSDRCKHTLLCADHSGIRFQERRASGLLQIQRQLKDVRQRLKGLRLLGTNFSAVCDKSQNLVCCYVAERVVPASGEPSRDTKPAASLTGAASDDASGAQETVASERAVSRFFEHLLLLTIEEKPNRRASEGELSGDEADRAAHRDSRVAGIQRKFRVVSEIFVLRSNPSQDGASGAAAVAAGLSKNEAMLLLSDTAKRRQLLNALLSLMSGGARDGNRESREGPLGAGAGSRGRSACFDPVEDIPPAPSGSNATLKRTGSASRSGSPSVQSSGSDRRRSVCEPVSLSVLPSFRALSCDDQNSVPPVFGVEGATKACPAASYALTTSRDADSSSVSVRAFSSPPETAGMWLSSAVHMSVPDLARQSSAEDNAQFQVGREGGALGVGGRRSRAPEPDSLPRHIDDLAVGEPAASPGPFPLVSSEARLGESPSPVGCLRSPLESPGLHGSDTVQAETGPWPLAGATELARETAAAVTAASRLLDQYACGELRTEKRESVCDLVAGGHLESPFHPGIEEATKLLMECGLRPREAVGDSAARAFAPSEDSLSPPPVGGREVILPGSAELMNALVQQLQHQLQQQIEQQLQLHRGTATERLRASGALASGVPHGASVSPSLSTRTKQLGRGNEHLEASEACPASAIEAAAAALLGSRGCSVGAARALRAPGAAPPALSRPAPGPSLSGSTPSHMDILGLDGSDDLHDFKEHCSVFISWIPRVARAEDYRQKDQMEKRLKLLFEVSLKVRGIVRIALFPPRGSHCCVLFDTPQAAQAFIRQYGGSTYTSSTERFKAEICAAHAVTFDRGIERVFVRIEEFKPQLLQQACGNQPMHGSGASGSGCSAGGARHLPPASITEGLGRQGAGLRHPQGPLGSALASISALRTVIENARQGSFVQHPHQQLLLLKQLRQEHSGEPQVEEGAGSTAPMSGFLPHVAPSALPEPGSFQELQAQRQRVLLRSQSAVQGALEIANFLSNRDGSAKALQQRRHPRFGRAATMDTPSVSWPGGSLQTADLRDQNTPAVHPRGCVDVGGDRPFAPSRSKPAEDELGPQQQLAEASARLFSELKPEEQAELGQLWQTLMRQQQSLIGAGQGAPGLAKQSPSQQLLTAGLQQIRRDQHPPQRRQRDPHYRGAERNSGVLGKHALSSREDGAGQNTGKLATPAPRSHRPSESRTGASRLPQSHRSQFGSGRGGQEQEGKWPAPQRCLAPVPQHGVRVESPRHRHGNVGGSGAGGSYSRVNVVGARQRHRGGPSGRGHHA
ncbi:hypothetical protein TGCAST_216190 [Toxoplasma gondii CAST]|uniref:Uncharacterized protein n=1 Tax=Toxoplasma gondii CAST TaxID=943122 RepID=A0A425HN51_TOXGO|nr:hypothetical protein TGCAST_216190 [Toxoplasma gondii CAST]